MRHYRLTKKGKQVAKAPVQARDALLDYLHEDKSNRGVSYEELAAVFGQGGVRGILRERVKKGLVEEVQSGIF